MECYCDLCEARKLSCHPFEIYFKGRLEAELVRANPNCPIYIYEQCAKDVKSDTEKLLALQRIKDFGKKFEYKDVVIINNHPMRFLLPLVLLLKEITSKMSFYLCNIEKQFTHKKKWQRVED